jgi:hypothetical protein
MRVWTISVLLLFAVSTPAYTIKEQTLQELIDRAQSARVDDRPGLYLEIMERQLKAADELYGEGKVNAASEALNDVVTYSDKARDSAIAVPKKLKNTEIAFRKSAARLRDIKRTLNFDDQAPVQSAVDHLERSRTEMLSHMFDKN